MFAIDLQRNQDCYTNEHEFVEDIGRNLLEKEKKIIARTWKTVAFSYGIRGYAGKYPSEPSVFVRLAESIGELSKGYIVVMQNGIFNLSKGIYSTGEFSCAKIVI
jgi:hypothetical protein